MSVSDFIRNALNTQNVVIKYELTADVPEIKKLMAYSQSEYNHTRPSAVPDTLSAPFLCPLL